jgi:chromosome segregation ATPase
MKDEMKKLAHENTDFFKENRDMKEQLRVLNENLRRETEMLVSRDRENNTLLSENQMLKSRLDEYRADATVLKDEQSRLIDNLRLQLNETRERLVELKDEKQKEFKKVKERFEDQRRREADQYTFELEKLRSEIAIAQKRLGQEEHFSKELAIINNKL